MKDDGIKFFIIYLP